MLASGGDDCSVLIWDLLSSGSNSAILQGGGAGGGGTQGPQPQQKHVNGVDSGATGGAAGGNGSGGGSTGATQGPSARWECDYEVANVSWAPRSSLTGGGRGGASAGGNAGGENDWLGVCAGRGVWGVEL